MANFFLILMGFFIVMANIVGFISYKKKKSLYSAAYTILLLAALFAAIGGILALLIIRDAFAIFYGLQVGYYLLINSFIVLLIAVIVTGIKNTATNENCQLFDLPMLTLREQGDGSRVYTLKEKQENRPCVFPAFFVGH